MFFSGLDWVLYEVPFLLLYLGICDLDTEHAWVTLNFINVIMIFMHLPISSTVKLLFSYFLLYSLKQVTEASLSWGERNLVSYLERGFSICVTEILL